MKSKLLFISMFSFGLAFATESRISKEQYIGQWSGVAIQEMLRNNIPASITLAQGILESASGNSELARQGNNHFGIKCHGWTGKKMYMDDDAKGECFRVYKSADESYVDHSDFLKKYDRYAFLFTYNTDDYKSWAKGLKKAGYATDPSYPDRLISIIEDLGLDQYDKVSTPEIVAQPTLIAQNRIKHNNHQIQSKENLQFVVAKEGDTFYSIAREFGLTLNQLRRYNDFETSKDIVVKGDIIYVKRKKGHDLFKQHEYIVEENCTLSELAQKTGVKASVIKKLNGYETEKIDLKKGQKITLR